MKKSLILVAVICMSCASAIAADILILNNGLAFEGKVARIKKCNVVFNTTGNKYVIPAADIRSIEFGDTQDHVYLNYIEGLRQDNACLKGTVDAQTFHGKRAGHFVLGFLFGPFALIGTAVSNPTPFRGRDTMMLSPNKDLFTDPQYLVCYKKKAKAQLIGMEAIGWGVFLVIYLASNPGA